MGIALQDREGNPLYHLLSHEDYMALVRAYASREVTIEDVDDAKKLIQSGQRGKSTAQMLALLESWKDNPPEFRR